MFQLQLQLLAVAAVCCCQYCSITSAASGASASAVGSGLPLCMSTQWSSVRWRVQVSQPVPFSLVAVQAAAAAATLDGVPQLLLTVCLGRGGKACTNATQPETWSGWHVYVPNTTLACAAYPNSGVDSAIELTTVMSVRGVAVGNMSNVAVQVQPLAPGRESQPAYTVNFRISPLRLAASLNASVGPKYNPFPRAPQPATPSVYFVVAAANDTTRPALENRRDVNRKYYAAMRAASAPGTGPRQPQLIKVVQGYHGLDDVDGYREAAAALAQMGSTGLKAARAAPAVAAILKEANIHFTAGRLGDPCSHAKCKNDHSFPAKTDAGVDESFRAWATEWVESTREVGQNMSSLTQLKMYDELGWEFPSLWVGQVLAPSPWLYTDMPAPLPHPCQTWPSEAVRTCVCVCLCVCVCVVVVVRFGAQDPHM